MIFLSPPSGNTYTKIGFLETKISTVMMCKAAKTTNMPKPNARHLTCTISDISLNHATGTYSTQWKQNTSLMKQHLKVYINGSTHGSWLLQVAFIGPSTVELTTCTIFIDTLCKHYPAIVVLPLWARHIGRPIFLM